MGNSPWVFESPPRHHTPLFVAKPTVICPKCRQITDIGLNTSQEDTMAQRPYNVQRRVAGRGGWIAMLSGESRGQALERALPELNAEGYRVAFIVEDKPSLGWTLLNALIAVCTLGFFWRTSGLLIIGEHSDYLAPRH